LQFLIKLLHADELIAHQFWQRKKKLAPKDLLKLKHQIDTTGKILFDST